VNEAILTIRLLRWVKVEITARYWSLNVLRANGGFC